MVLRPLKVRIRKDKITSLDDMDEKVGKKAESEELAPFKNLTFRFDMLCSETTPAQLSEEECVKAGSIDFNLCEYERLKLLMYNYNYKKSLIKNAKEKNAWSYIDDMISYLNMFDSAFFTELKFLKKYRVYYVEKEINKLPSIKAYLKKFENGYTYPQLNIKLLRRDKDFMGIIEKAVKKSSKELTKYFKQKLAENPKKSICTQNIHWYLDLICKDNKKIRDLAELHFLLSNSSFYNRLYGGRDLSDCLKRLDYKDMPLSEIIKYSNTLFSVQSDKADLSEATLFLIRVILLSCSRGYKTKEELINSFIPKGKQIDLTSKDFYYVKQYEYIKSILDNAIKKNSKGINILIYGAPGGGKTALSRVLIDDLKVERYEIPNDAEIDNDVNAVQKETVLGNEGRIVRFKLISDMLKENKNCALLYDEAEDFFRKNDNKSQSKAAVNKFLEDNPNPVIWTTNSLGCMEESYLRRFTYVLNIDNLPKDVYNNVLTKLCNKYKLELPEDIKNLYLEYRPNFGIVEKTFNNFNLSESKDIDLLKQDLMDSLQGFNFGYSIKKLPVNKFKFNPELINASENLIDLTKNIKQAGRLDFSMLLWGVPGSSKTSYARYLAEELGLTVINKNYTELSSMWVGETEKNIANLFAQAEQEKALIILDEADVLLQDRKKSFRSWEITQTEALLTAMEFHPYPFIMTTNLYENLDAAVMRRILYKVKHDYLTKDQIKLAFKHFFDLDITENLYLSRLTSGDFAVIKKQAEYQGKMKDKEWLIQKLTEEMNQKKMTNASKTIVM